MLTQDISVYQCMHRKRIMAPGGYEVLFALLMCSSAPCGHHPGKALETATKTDAEQLADQSSHTTISVVGTQLRQQSRERSNRPQRNAAGG